MSTPSDHIATTLSRIELETLLRRIVREELTHLLSTRRCSILDDWRHEGPDDPEADAELLAEVMAMIEREQTSPTSTIPWDQAKADLAQAEALGELPD